MEPSRVAAVLVAAVLAVSLAYAAVRIGSAPRVGPAPTPAAGVVGTGIDAPAVRLGGRVGAPRPVSGAATHGSALPPLLAAPRASAQ